MLKCIEVKDFQALKHVTVDLCPGVNVVVGPSDVGKSSLMRAVRLASQPAEGSDFVREGAKSSLVKLETGDGRMVERRKGARSNSFSLDGKKLPKPGRTVPEPVNEALNMAPVVFGEGTERCLNFSEQGEPAFLVADSPSEAGRILGGLSGAAILSQAVRSAARSAQSLAKDASASAVRLERAEAALREHDGLAAELEAHARIVEQVEEVERRSARVDLAARLVARWYEASDACAARQGERLVAGARAEVVSQADELAARVDETKRIGALLARLSVADSDAQRQGEAAEVARGRLSALRETDDIVVRLRRLGDAQRCLAREFEARSMADDLAGELSVTQGRIDALAGVDELWDRLGQLGRARAVIQYARSVSATLRTAAREKGNAEGHRVAVEENWQRFLADNPVCPLCGGTWKEKA